MPLSVNQEKFYQLLMPLLSWAIDFSPWYQQHPKYQDVFNRLRSRNDVPEDLWSALPIIEKADLRQSNSLFYASETPDQHGKVTESHTSGSTGMPVVIKKTAGCLHVGHEHTLREFQWRQRDISKKHCFINYLDDYAHLGEGLDLEQWGPPFEKTGPASAIHMGQSIDNIATWLIRHDPDYLLATPSIIDDLLRVIPPDRLSRMLDIKMFAEPLSASLAQRVRESWGASCSNVYSASEVGTIAFCCAEENALHVQQDEILVEVVHEDGRACQPGETGRVLLTPLYNYATPLFRYSIGDYATVGPACSCGRPGMVLDKVNGRERNMFMRPDGSRFWPVDIHRLRDVAPVQQTQLVQTSRKDITLNVVLSRPFNDGESHMLVGKMQELLGYPYQVTVQTVASIPRGRGNKFEECLSLLGH